MKFFLAVDDDKVSVQIRAESEDGLIVGDYNEDFGPGDSFSGINYERLREMGNGEHELEAG